MGFLNKYSERQRYYVNNELKSLEPFESVEVDNLPTFWYWLFQSSLVYY